MNEEMQVVLDKLATVTEEVNVDRVFGKPQQYGDRTVIPVVSLMYGIAFGAGGAEGGAKSEVACCAEDDACCSEQEKTATSPEAGAGPSAGSGAGGASGAIARPMAYIEIDAEGVYVKPIVNEQIVAVAGICLVGWALAWLGAVLMTIFGPRSS